MNEIGKTPIEMALQRCASEQIHFAGAIQEHGVLLAVDEAGLLRMASDNLQTLFGCTAENALAHPVADLIGGAALLRLRAALAQSHGPGSSPGLALNPEQTGVPVALWATVHRSGPLLLIELTPQTPIDMAQQDRFLAVKQVLDSDDHGIDVERYCDYIAHTIHQMTGFDRVMVYRFDSRWNGAVLAESRNQALPALLGHHFPASDIPPQARALYEKNLMRVLLDTEAATVPIVPAHNPPLDLSHSSLRAISPVHIEYVRNMGVRSTITLSLMHEGRLWGLVACHSAQVKRLSAPLHEELAFVGKVVGMRLSALENSARLKSMDSVRQRLQRLTEKMRDASDIHFAFRYLQTDFLDLANASGSYIVFGEKSHVIGEVPPEAALLALVAWLKQQEMKDGVFITDSLATAYPPAKAYAQLASGLLAVALDADNHSFILWFRPETLRTIPWGGSPYANVVADELGPRIDPRRSFAAWMETAGGFSVPWSSSTVDAVTMFSFAVVQLLMQQVRQEVVVAVAANQAKTEFVSTVSHELRTPLTSISGALGLVLGGVLGAVPERMKSVLDIAHRNALRLSHLINDLLDIEKIVAGKMRLENQMQPLMPLIEQSLESIKAYGEKYQVSFVLLAGEVQAQREQIQVCVDGNRLQQVLVNLLSNAAKFSPSGAQVQLEVKQTDLRVRVSVIDHGSGIPPEFRGRIFQKFSQADVSNNRGKGGTGLGLAISRELIEAMGGTIDYESVPGQGSRFYFDLPIWGGVNSA
jgi:light-regulated signal transduction histidine kinase (bacteriophytochrome)